MLVISYFQFYSIVAEHYNNRGFFIITFLLLSFVLYVKCQPTICRVSVTREIGNTTKDFLLLLFINYRISCV